MSAVTVGGPGLVAVGSEPNTALRLCGSWFQVATSLQLTNRPEYDDDRLVESSDRLVPTYPTMTRSPLTPS